MTRTTARMVEMTSGRRAKEAEEGVETTEGSEELIRAQRRVAIRAQEGT